MPLTAGTRLGPYEIVATVGAGGMGEVYRARDTKLNRDVALKILLPLVADDPDRLTRFRREAQVLAALNHPHIAQIYGFEDSGATHALVMELVEGPTLADRIAQGALPASEATAIAKQIADALAAAHDQGIVHRDLKPANVKVREDGTVKVLDFGLAKAMASDGTDSSAQAMNSPTLTARGTQLGMIIGTAAYMAPEQAKGRAVDRRADVWAFGVVFFEMLAGRRAFDGDDVSEILASVLKTDPDWAALPADLHPAIRRLLRRCLERDPKRRLRDVAEGMLQLEEGLAEPAASAPGSVVVAVTPPRPLWRRALPEAIAVVATAGVIGLISFLTARPSAPPEVMRFTHVPALAAPLRVSALTSNLTISHDGRTLVYSASPTNGTPLLFVRPIDKLDATALRGAEGGTEPFMSPDDAWVGFVDASSQVQVKKFSIFGGPPVVITNTKLSILGCAWMADGSIVIGSRAGLFSARDGDASGQQVELTKPDASLGETAHGWPSAIPGTLSVLFATSTGQEGQLAVLDRPGGRIIRLKLAGTKPRYLPSGHIAFVAVDGSLRLVPFDLARLEVTGNPVPADVTVAVKVNGAADFNVSRDGRLIYAGGGEFAAERSIVWVDRSGHETPVGAPMRAYFYARISPDATRLSLDIRDKQSAIWIWDMRGSLTRLTATDGSDQYGLWNPDGQRVIGSSLSGLKNGLFQSRANATGGQELLLEKSAAFPNAVTPDGKTLIFRAPGANGKNDLFAVPMGGDRTAKPLIATEHDELNAAISPDGKWLAYQSDLTGRMEIYVRPFPDVDANQWTISTAGGVKPVWGPRDGELLYLAGDSLISVRVTPTFARGLSVGAPVALFPVSAYFFGGIGRNYDISPDGKRFVMFKNPPTATGGSAPITVVLNWLEDVKARAPIKR